MLTYTEGKFADARKALENAETCETDVYQTTAVVLTLQGIGVEIAALREAVKKAGENRDREIAWLREVVKNAAADR